LTINIFDATKLIDEVLGGDEIDFLLAARQGVALQDVEDHTMKVMKEHNLIDILPFDHPRASNAILGVVPSEDGVKVLNVLDDRKWAEARNGISSEPAMPEENDEAVLNAQSASKDIAGTDGEIPADDPHNVRTEYANQEARETQEAQFESGNPKAKAKDLDKNYRAKHANKTEEK